MTSSFFETTGSYMDSGLDSKLPPIEFDAGDLDYFVNTFKNVKEDTKIRMGVITAIDTSTYTVTVQIAGAVDSSGSAVTIANVSYLNSFYPIVGQSVWLLSFGTDLIALGQQADLTTTYPYTNVTRPLPATKTHYPADTAMGTTAWATLIGSTNTFVTSANVRVLLYLSVEWIVVGTAGYMVASTTATGATTFGVDSNYRVYAENVDGTFHSAVIRPVTLNAGTTTFGAYGYKTSTSLTTATASNTTLNIQPLYWI